MLRRLLKNKKAQNTAEYAILIALVVGAIIAIQVYVQRGLQGKMKAAGQFLAANTTITESDFGGTMLSKEQYEPYYSDSQYEVTTNSSEFQFAQGSNVDTERTFGTNIDTTKTRDAGGRTITRAHNVAESD